MTVFHGNKLYRSNLNFLHLQGSLAWKFVCIQFWQSRLSLSRNWYVMWKMRLVCSSFTLSESIQDGLLEHSQRIWSATTLTIMHSIGKTKMSQAKNWGRTLESIKSRVHSMSQEGQKPLMNLIELNAIYSLAEVKEVNDRWQYMKSGFRRRSKYSDLLWWSSTLQITSLHLNIDLGRYCNLCLPSFIRSGAFRFWQMPINFKVSSICQGHNCARSYQYGLWEFSWENLRVHANYEIGCQLLARQIPIYWSGFIHEVCPLSNRWKDAQFCCRKRVWAHFSVSVPSLPLHGWIAFCMKGKL